MSDIKKYLPKKDSENLSKAYMNLYKKLVRAYQSNGNSVGQSQFNAMCTLREIITAHETQKDNNAIKFLVELYNTHKSVVAKQTMISSNKDEIEPIGEEGYDEVISAIHNFEQQIINSVAENPVVKLKTALRINRGHTKTFIDWVNETATNEDIDRLEHDLAYFGKMYRNFVMQQKYNK